MDENRSSDIKKEEDVPQFRGLYRHVKISVRTLDIIIVCCIIVIIVATITGMQPGGLNVSFDSRGGTDVAYVEAEFDSVIAEPEPPTREGYSFSGWYIDPAGGTAWDFEKDRVQNDMTLYAVWEQK